MSVRGNLFIKVFLGFWLVSIAILGSWMVAARYFESFPQTNPRGTPGGPPPRFMKQLIYDLQNRSDEELPALLESVKEQYGLDIYLLKRDGQDIYERELVLGVDEMAVKLKERRRAFLETKDKHVFGHSIYRDGQGRMRAVVVSNPPRPGLITALGKNLWLRVTLAVLISGLVCFLLSRAMTNRFQALQVTSRRLAEGDLGARISVREHGGDETDELARDFNAMAEKIEQQLKAQRRLLSDVSHELRSPLARLRIALALAESDDCNNSRHLERIDHEAARLEELIAQLLSSQGTEATLDNHIDLVALLQELCTDANFEGAATGKHVTFGSDCEDAVVATSADLLKKSFENILRNALKYTIDSSAVTVTLSRDTEDYRITIEDCGPGVPEQELDKLFDEFYRLDSARARDTGGYGLGLSIARRAINQHGGSISARNTDNGLAIHVSLPAYTE